MESYPDVATSSTHLAVLSQRLKAAHAAASDAIWDEGMVVKMIRGRLVSAQARVAADMKLEPSTSVTRRPLAVLAADVFGYSRMTEAAEEDTHCRLRALKVRTINPTLVNYRGQIIKNTGDGFLAVFDSPIDAVRCAIELQREISASEAPEPPDRRIHFRMGLNGGDVITEGGDVYGIGVTIAARLEQQASPGGILISATLLEQTRSRLDIKSKDIGELRLKNISRPVHAYSLEIGGTSATRRKTRSPRRARVPSIAVLPFRTHGIGSDQDYFGDGIIEDIIVALAGIKGLFVISRTSTVAYRRGEVDIQKVGQELGVRYVLHGTIRRREDQIRITAQLVDGETGSILWADHYDGNITELFELQTRIATRIVWSIAPHVREAELRRALRKRPDNLNAYELLMQAIDLIYRMNFLDFSRAGALLQKAIQADDSYSAAYAYAALWHIHNVNQQWSHDQKSDTAEAVRLAAAAVERDPTDGFALAIYGHTKAVLLHEYEAAIATFERALAAAPSNAMAWTLSSGAYSYVGNGKEAVERAERGLRLSPVDTQAFFYLTFLGVAHYVHGTFDEAVVWGRKSMGLNPGLCANLRFLIGSLVALGRMEEAQQVAKALLEVQPRFRLSVYAGLCALRQPLRTEFIERLRRADLPE